MNLQSINQATYKLSEVIWLIMIEKSWLKNRNKHFFSVDKLTEKYDIKNVVS